jgi:hypothetical protein
VYYVADSRQAIARFRSALSARGIDVEHAASSGALLEDTHDEAHLEGGRFESERMLRLLNEAVETALNDGFTGLRTCGDMSWLVDHPPGATQVVEYEALLNQLFRGVRACGMCQYDRRRLPPEYVDHGLATHSSVVIERRHKPNPFYQRATAAMRRAPESSMVDWKIAELRRK